MKKLLIIANLFHASPRIPGMVTYLTEFGWEATIVTPPLGSNPADRLGFPEEFLKRVKIVEAPYRGDILWMWRYLFKSIGYITSESITEQIKERLGVSSKLSFVDLMLKWYQTIFAFPDTERTWRTPALKAAHVAFKKGTFDAILSSSPFPTSHIVAAQLKRRYRLPWIADYRDPWTSNHNYPFCGLRKLFDEKLELATMKQTDAFITVSPACARKIGTLHGVDVAVITNGFDPESVAGNFPNLTKAFTITYTGTIYTDKQNPGLFLKVIAKLIKERIIDKNDVALRFYGTISNSLRNEIISNGLEDVVTLYGHIARRQIYEKQRESHLLLLLNWEDETEKGIFPSKLFEYLSAKRPIIATGGFSGDVTESIMAETKSGFYAVTPEEIEVALSLAYKHYKCNGHLPYHGDEKKIEKYSYREGAFKLAGILDNNRNKVERNE